LSGARAARCPGGDGPGAQCPDPGRCEEIIGRLALGATVRSNLIAHLGHLIDGSDAWTARKRDELVGLMKTKPGLRRYLRRTKAGLPRIDHGAAKREAHLDGKWLLRTSDITLTPEDLAAAYKQLLAVERGWRDMKGALGLRPVFHYREDRFRCHVQLCWLALLLIRVAENTTGDTWRNIRHELDRMHLVTLATPQGTVTQRTALTPGQKTILDALELPEPPRFFDFTTPTSWATPPRPKHAVVTRLQHIKTAYALLSAHIQAIVCPSSAEVRTAGNVPHMLGDPPAAIWHDAAFLGDRPFRRPRGGGQRASPATSEIWSDVGSRLWAGRCPGCCGSAGRERFWR
jgi:hypothetical protein